MIGDSVPHRREIVVVLGERDEPAVVGRGDGFFAAFLAAAEVAGDGARGDCAEVARWVEDCGAVLGERVAAVGAEEDGVGFDAHGRGVVGL